MYRLSRQRLFQDRVTSETCKKSSFTACSWSHTAGMVDTILSYIMFSPMPCNNYWTNMEEQVYYVKIMVNIQLCSQTEVISSPLKGKPLGSASPGSLLNSDWKCCGQSPIPLQCILTYSISPYTKALLHPGLEIMSPIPLFIASLYLLRPYKEMTPTP